MLSANVATSGDIDVAAFELLDVRVRDRYRARRLLWRESVWPRVRGCGRVAVDATGVVLRRSVDPGTGHPSAGFAGVATCGSVWSCPCCAAKIAHVRADEVASAISSWHDQGGTVALVTLTMLHRRGQTLAELWDALSYAWDAAWSSYAGRGHRKLWSIRGYCRVVELTHGKNGWHVHVHALLFMDPLAELPGSPVGVGGPLFVGWAAALVRKGLRSPRAADGGLDCQVVARGSGFALGAYFAKSTFDTASAHRAAVEVARGDLKTARGEHRAPFLILRDVLDLGDAGDLALWHEYERASRGRRQMLWSHGMRQAAGITAAELTDEQAAELDAGGDDVVEIPTPAFQQLVADELEVELLTVCRLGAAGVRPWLDAHGIPWLAPPTRSDVAARRLRRRLSRSGPSRS